MAVKKADNTEPAETDTISHRILKESSCTSLSGGATLRYQIGCDDEKNLYVRIKSNSGGGYFHRGYVPLQSLLEAMQEQEHPFTSSVFKKLFLGKSNNNQGFILVVLVAERLVTPVENKYVAADPKAFHSEVKNLMDKKPTAKEKTP